MSREDFEGEVVAVGAWFYGDLPKRIEVVGFDCDYFVERMTYMSDRVEPLPVGADGLLYYLKVEGEVLELDPFATVEDAQRWATAQPWRVTWE